MEAVACADFSPLDSTFNFWQIIPVLWRPLLQQCRFKCFQDVSGIWVETKYGLCVHSILTTYFCLKQMSPAKKEPLSRDNDSMSHLRAKCTQIRFSALEIVSTAECQWLTHKWPQALPQ